MRRLILAAMLAAAAATARAEPPRDAAAPPVEDAMADLERAFWACDYLATTEGLLAAPLAACRHVNDEIRRVKFAGDLDALLAWWRANKAQEHLKLAALRRR